MAAIQPEWRGGWVMTVRGIARTLFVLSSLPLLAAGAGLYLARTGLLPGLVQGFLDGVTEGSANTLHVAQEFGSFAVFAGLAGLWCARRYDQSGPLHAALTVAWGLFAFAHWVDVRGPNESLTGPIINTVPFALFAAVGLLRLAADGRSTKG
jgi:hypothetical protein